MTKPPCKPDGIDCSRRYIGCHAECEEYHAWLAIHAGEKQRQKQDRNPADDFLIEQQARVKNARHRDYMRGYRK